MGSRRAKAQDGEGSFGKYPEQVEPGLPVSPFVYDRKELKFSPPFASQASAMSQSSGTTYSTGTGSTSSATTVTSPGTSKGSWGDMMTSTNTGQVNQARPLPIPEGQSGKLDPVSLLSIWHE